MISETRSYAKRLRCATFLSAAPRFPPRRQAFAEGSAGRRRCRSAHRHGTPLRSDTESLIWRPVFLKNLLLRPVRTATGQEAGIPAALRNPNAERFPVLQEIVEQAPPPLPEVAGPSGLRLRLSDIVVTSGRNADIHAKTVDRFACRDRSCARSDSLGSSFLPARPDGALSTRQELVVTAGLRSQRRPNSLRKCGPCHFGLQTASRRKLPT